VAKASGNSDEGAAARRDSRMLAPKECALLLLRLVKSKEAEKGDVMSRFRVSELSLQRLWGRHRIPAAFLDDVNEWLFRAGRVLFFAGSSYGVILISAVENWARLSSNRLGSELDDALTGALDFAELETLLSGSSDSDEESKPAHIAISGQVRSVAESAASTGRPRRKRDD
jgi:hypothetical protein